MTDANAMSWFIDTSIAVTILTAVILAIRKPVARHIGPYAAYGLWLLPLLRVVLPDIAVLPNTHAVIPHEQSSTTTAVLPALAINREPSTQAMPEPRRAETAQSTHHEFSYNVDPLTSHELIETPAVLGSTIANLLIFLWLAIGALWLGAALCCQGMVHARLRQSTFAGGATLQGELTAILTDLGIKRSVDIRIGKPNLAGSHADQGPLVSGIIRPVIILPAAFHQHYTPNERHMTLLHECMHIRRGDLFMSFVGLTFRALNWANPVIHLAWNAFRTDQEAACDASVLRHLNKLGHDERGEAQLPAAFDYASALVKSASLAATFTRAPTPTMTMIKKEIAHASLPSLTHQHSNHHVKERLMLIKTSTRRNRALELGAAASALIVGLGLTANYTYAAPNSDESETITNGDGKIIVIRKDKDKSKPNKIVTRTILRSTNDANDRGGNNSFSLSVDDDDAKSMTINGVEIGEMGIVAALEALSSLDKLESLESLQNIEGIDALAMLGDFEDDIAIATKEAIIDLGEESHSDEKIRFKKDGDNLHFEGVDGQFTMRSSGEIKDDHEILIDKLIFKEAEEIVILRTEGDANNISLQDEKMFVNGNEISLDQCRDEKGKSANIVMRVKDKNDGGVEVVCEKKSTFKVKSNRLSLLPVWDIEDRTDTETRIAILRQLLEGKQRHQERAVEREQAVVERAREKAQEAANRARESLERAQERQERAAEERDREIERLRSELDRLESQKRREAGEAPISAPRPLIKADPAPAPVAPEFPKIEEPADVEEAPLPPAPPQ